MRRSDDTRAILIGLRDAMRAKAEEHYQRLCRFPGGTNAVAESSASVACSECARMVQERIDRIEREEQS